MYKLLNCGRSFIRFKMAETPSVNSMINAIKCNSFQLVGDCFKDGFNANSVTEINCKLEFEEGPNNEIEQDVSPSIWFSTISVSSMTVSMPLIYFAIRNCYGKFQQPQERVNAQKILDLFLDHGALVTKTVNGNFLMCNIVGYKWATMEENTNALDFAVYLKTTIHDNTRSSIMSAVIAKLSVTKSNNDAGLFDSDNLTLVPVKTLNIWKSLLLNESFSDVYFVCGDDPNKKLYAHKAVLASASDYFRVLFTGNWQESVDCLNGHGIKTKNSVSIMEGLLTFIYTGNINDLFTNCNVIEVLELSSQWGLESLQLLCERRCIQTLHAKSVIPILKFASSHNSEHLKLKCFNFIRRNSITVLTSKSGMALRSENIDLWNELMTAIGGEVEVEVESNTTEEGKEDDVQIMNGQV